MSYITQAQAVELSDLGIIQNDSLLYWHNGSIERFKRRDGSVSAFIEYEIDMLLPPYLHGVWLVFMDKSGWGSWPVTLTEKHIALVLMIKMDMWTVGEANRRFINERQKEEIEL